jgi:hypothetical protein
VVHVTSLVAGVLGSLPKLPPAPTPPQLPLPVPVPVTPLPTLP